MNIKKKLYKIIFITLLIQFSESTIRGMSFNSPVEIYFLPEDIAPFKQKLNTLLENAKEQVLVAMYWLTDQDIINTLTSLKENDIDVQIIFDESVQNKFNLNSIINQFMQHGIAPHVLPKINGSMHNKFVVIDEEITITGSANFTQTVLSKSSNYFNNENVVIFNSNQIAKKYAETFFEIETDIATIYIEYIAEGKNLNNWIRNVSQYLYNNQPGFPELVNENLERFNQTQKNRIKIFFNIPTLQQLPAEAMWQPPIQHFRQDPPTPKQEFILRQKNRYRPGMSKQEATRIIGEILKPRPY